VDLPHRTFDEQTTDAAAWLAIHARPSTTGRADSYELKHRVQRDVGRYVSSRAVVAAAVAAGHRIVGQPTRAGNAWLAMTIGEGRVNAIRRRSR
jgi:hypothetical protein